MNKHEVDFSYFSQEHLLSANCFDMPLIIDVVEKTLLAFEKGSIMFPELMIWKTIVHTSRFSIR